MAGKGDDLNAIKLIAFDIDGVLTDGQIEVDEFGNEKKNIFLPDLDYMNKLHREGYILVAITGENTKICDFFAERYPWDRFYKGCKQKDKTLEDAADSYGFLMGQVCYIGDGVYDVPALRKAGVSICPHNATQDAKKEADIILTRDGGKGCVEELYHLLTRDSFVGITEKSNHNHYNMDILLSRYPNLSGIAENIEEAYGMLEECFKSGKKLLVAGNGGSAADSEHIVGELMKSFRCPRPISSELSERLMDIDRIRGGDLSAKLERPLTAISLTAHEALTSAFSNDVDAKLIYAQQLLGYGREGDVLLVISTSGNSENIINAAILAKAMGIKVIGLTGGTGGEIAGLADCAVVVPETETHMIQELHIPIYHWWCVMLENRFFNEEDK